VAKGLVEIDQEKAIDTLLAAIQTARLIDREEIFWVLGEGAEILAEKDHGQTLWRVYEAITQVDSWWNDRIQ
jgi:hypothetical protein